MMQARQAVILAAGKGTRLRQLGAAPKCLLTVEGMPLIHQMIENLAAVGVREVVLVVGYRAELVRQALGETFANCRVTYLLAPDFETTNNSASLWRARAAIRPPFLLLEGDLWLSSSALGALVVPSAAAVSPLEPSMRGSAVVVDGAGTIERLLLGEEVDREREPLALWKTVNAYSFSERDWYDALEPALDHDVSSGATGAFYEASFRLPIAHGDCRLRAVEVPLAEWAEIDTPEDVAPASQRVRRTRVASLGRR